MNRLILTCATVLFVLIHASLFARSQPMPRGVILVVIDDIGYGDINALNRSTLRTPNLDTLHKQSIRFTDFHVGTTCAPSRASLLTGRRINATGVWHTIAGRELLREDEQTMAEIFRANGWNTGVFGKWHLGEGYPYSPRFRGFDVSVIHGGGGIGQGPDYWGNDYYSGIGRDGASTDADVYFENGETFEADRFCTDYWFNRSMQFIQESVAEEKPFFCYLPTNAAHSPFNAPHGYKEGFDGLIENIDTNMGRLDEFLTEQGIKDDVLVIFTTDNGTAGSRLGGLRGKKGSNYDGGHNVPCFWRWKNGGMGGSTSTARDVASLTAGMDMLPTFMDLFRLQRPEGGLPIHGVSLREMILNPDYVPVDRTVVVDTQRRADLIKWSRACVMRDEVEDGVIKHKWRLIRQSSDAEPELYDFLVDRDTDDNVASGNSEVIASLTEYYDEWWLDVSPGRESFPPFVVNPDMESEMVLFAHSWIGADATPWHQDHVRNGGKGTRIHSVRFDSSGRYEIELRRWPREDGGSIAGVSSDGEGTEIPATRARIVLEGVGEATKPVQAGNASVVFEMDVSIDKPTTLETSFLDDADTVLSGAYYVYIRAMNESDPGNNGDA